MVSKEDAKRRIVKLDMENEKNQFRRRRGFPVPSFSGENDRYCKEQLHIDSVYCHKRKPREKEFLERNYIDILAVSCEATNIAIGRVNRPRN